MALRSALLILAVTLALAASATAQAPAPGPAPAAPGNRIAFIDVQRVIARSAAGAAVRDQLEKERAAMQKEMDAKLEELKRLNDELEKKGALMTPEARREKQETFERRRRDTARLADDFQKELEKKERAFGQRILQEVVGLVERFGKERGYYLIVEKRSAGVLYGAGDADLTDEIIRTYDREAGNKGKK